MQFRKFTRRAVAALTLVLLLAAAVWAWRAACGGVSHREIKDAVQDESRRVQDHVDSRCNAMERKLDRIESKLDRLIDMVAPKLPDGMKAVE